MVKNYKKIELSPKYTPKKSEPYMCPEQLAYFYQLLNTQRDEILQDRDSVLSDVRMAEKNETAGVGDEQDQASAEQEITMNLRMSERTSNLLQKINAAFLYGFKLNLAFTSVHNEPICFLKSVAPYAI